MVGSGPPGEQPVHDLGGPDTEVEANGTARGAKVIVDPATNVCNRDVAFVVLDEKLSAPVSPIRLGPPALDERLAAVGWGIDETGMLPESREVRPEIPLIGVGPAMYPGHATFGYGDHEFMLGESACAGDSGSPAFAKSGAVVGVAARAGNGMPRDPKNYASTCIGENAHAVYTHLASLQDLVSQAFAEAGEAMWLEGQPDPRAPKPQTMPEEEPGGPPATTPTEEVDFPPDAPSTPAAAGGCSISSEPQKGAVEYAAGLIALIASLVGLRRRFARSRDDDGVAQEQRARMHSMP